jgi:C-terminal processing protease CtpA/Prc
VGNPALASRVHLGEELVAIDNVPVHQYAEQQIAPFVSASTSQDKALRTYTYQLLSGAADKPVALRLRSVEGGERTEIVERGETYRGPQQFEFRMLPGEIAYLSLDQFENDEALKQLAIVFPQILTAKGLVLDVRRNGGGNGGIGLEVLSYLSRDPIETAASFVRADDVVLRAQGGPHIRWMPAPWSNRKFQASHKEIYSGPVAVLTGAQTFSAAEDFAVAFRSMKRGLIIGEATGGSTGQPLMFDLPGGGKARICVKRDTYPDGTPFVGIGVLPDIVVGPTIASLRSGTDPVLERALTELRKH